MKKNIYLQRIKELIESSTMHGISNAFKTRILALRIFWIIIFLVFLVYSSYTVILTIINFFQYNVIVNIEISQSFDLEFPAVTFCNINPYDLTIKENYKKASKLMNTSLFDDKLENKNCDQNLKFLFRQELHELEGFSLEKMLISCEYDRKTCNMKNFYAHKFSLFGNCYTFNFGKDSHEKKIPIEYAQKPGMFNGLKIKLFTGAREYQPCWENNFGVIVSVHNQLSMPLLGEEAVFVSAGSESNLAIDRININKLSKPYSDCVENLTNNKEIDSEFFKKTIYLNGIYRQKWCMLECSSNRTLEENVYKCKKLNFSSSSERKICLHNVENLTKHYQYCSHQCPIECNYSSFEIHSSMSSFPSYRYAMNLLSNNSFVSKFPYENVSLEQLRDSVLSFNVFYSSSTINKIEEKPEINFGMLLGSIGGQLGFFLGASLLTLTELFQILIEIGFIFCTKNK